MATATISFGLVSIPVKLYTTTRSSESISFRMLHARHKTPLKQKYWSVEDDEPVERDQIVKGYEYSKNQFVIVTPEELKAVEEAATRAIAIEEFIPLDKIDGLYFDKSYFLGPDKGGERAYALLSRAMEERGLGGLAKFAMRGKQYLVVIRPHENGILLQQLRYANEVKTMSELEMDEVEVKDAELNLAYQLIDQSTSETFDPSKYHDEVKDRVKDLIQQKIDGEEVTIVSSEAPKAQIIDLMEALKASIGEADPKTKASVKKKDSKRAASKNAPKRAKSSTTKKKTTRASAAKKKNNSSE
jgi:DNA end-binding protein Ku